jgi:hypothetical protein
LNSRGQRREFKQGVAVLLFYALAIPCGAFLDYLSFKTWETDWKEQAAVGTGMSVLWFVGRFVYTFFAVTRQRDAE